MGTLKVTISAAACSWIDPNTGLPEVDKSRVILKTASRAFLTGNAGYRFCNFMEVSAEVDGSRRLILSRQFTRSSRMYRGPSYLRVPSHAFLIKQDIFDESDAVRFTQVTGARTVSPEVIGTGGGILIGAAAGAGVGSVVPVVGTALGALAGAAIGAFVGEVGVRQFVAFPPIWSKLQMRIYRDGRAEAQLLQHSIFPSLTFYRQVGENFAMTDTSDGEAFYDATKTFELPEWQADGWGALAPKVSPGPCAGNPWGIRKGVTGGEDVIPDPVN